MVELINVGVIIFQHLSKKSTAETIVMLWSGASHQVTTLKAAWGKSWEEIERHKMVGPVDP